MYYFIIGIFIFIFSCSQPDDPNNRLNQFNDFLGEDKAESLNDAVKSYEQFIFDNFRDQGTRELLKVLTVDFSPRPNWKFQTDRNIQILNHLEQSGMRKEISIHSNEKHISDYDFDKFLTNNNESEKSVNDSLILPEDFEIELPANSESKAEEVNLIGYSINSEGQFMYGLAKFSADSTVINYVRLLYEMGDISPSLLAGGFLNFDDSVYENPFIKRIIVAHIYLDLVRMDIKKK